MHNPSTQKRERIREIARELSEISTAVEEFRIAYGNVLREPFNNNKYALYDTPLFEYLSERRETLRNELYALRDL